MGQLLKYEQHLREQNILPAARPRSNVIDDFTPLPTTKETSQMVCSLMF